jgi:hypothetical protein
MSVPPADDACGGHRMKVRLVGFGSIDEGSNDRMRRVRRFSGTLAPSARGMA